jgi:uncharacterized protein (DUF1501 family)
MNRRLFIQTLNLSGVSLMIPRFGMAASTAPPAKYFVFIRMQGGWDVTLGLDPQVHATDEDQNDMFIEYRPDEILKAGALSLGPAMASLTKYGKSMSIVNGIITATSDNGHPANLEYMSSGNGSGKAPYIPAEIAASSPSGSLGLVFQGQTSTLDRNVVATSTGNVEALRSYIPLGDFSDSIAQSGVKDSFYRAQNAMMADATRIADLNQKMAESKYDQETDQSLRAAKILAATFASGTAFQGQIDLNGQSLDSHTNHEKIHLASQKAYWDSIAGIFNIFSSVQLGTSGSSLYDQTMFMVISEFSRTPALNAGKGKDHNPLTNSTLFAGGSIQGGVTFGSSHLIPRKKTKSGLPSHTALPVNLATGVVAKSRAEVDAGGFQYITPETLVATVAQAQNVDWAKFRSVGHTTPFIKSLLKP